MSKYNPDSSANGVLENKLGIIDPEELKAAEASICHVRMIELSLSPVKGHFRPWRKIHVKKYQIWNTVRFLRTCFPEEVLDP